MNEDGKNGLNTENQDDKTVNANENKPKRFRDKALSVIQKIILVFLACLMLITVLPVGMFKRVNPVEKRGSLIRLYPSEMKASDYADADATAGLDKNSGAILEFDLENLNSVDIKDVRQIKLRLGFVCGSGEPGQHSGSSRSWCGLFRLCIPEPKRPSRTCIHQPGKEKPVQCQI